MNDYAFLLAITGVLIAGAMSPGPSFLVVARNTLQFSRSHGIATSVGTGLGVAGFALLASFGVTTLIQTIPQAYIIFKSVGGAYLLYLACLIWRGAHEPLESNDTHSTHTSYLKAFSQGLITQISNPKTALVIAGIFAAFVPTNPPKNTTILVVLIAFIIDMGWYVIVAISLSTTNSRRLYHRAKFRFDRTAAIFLGAVGVRLLFSKLEGD